MLFIYRVTIYAVFINGKTETTLYRQWLPTMRYDIIEIVVPIRISLIEGCCQQGSYWIKVSYTISEIEVITSNVVRFPPWLCWPLWNIWVTNDHGNVPLVVSTFRSFPHSWLITGLVTRLTRRASLVQQKLRTLPEHLRSPPAFSGVRVTRSFVVYVCFNLVLP